MRSNCKEYYRVHSSAAECVLPLTKLRGGELECLMKAVTLALTGARNEKAVKQELFNLSGVVAVDLKGQQAVVHCGDELSNSTLLQTVAQTGCTAMVVNEQVEQ